MAYNMQENCVYLYDGENGLRYFSGGDSMIQDIFRPIYGTFMLQPLTLCWCLWSNRLLVQFRTIYHI